MANVSGKILLIGYGNPGRLDDGLGPALADAVTAMKLPGVTVESNYQLTVEDAATVAEHDVVVFADAALSGLEPFSFRRIEPKAELSFTTHSVEPEAVLGLAWELFGARTRGYVLGVRGYAFNEFGETLSERARINLAAAASFLRRAFRDGRLCAAGAESPDLKDAGRNGDRRCKMAST